MYRDWIERETKQAADVTLQILTGQTPEDQLIVAPVENSGPAPWEPDAETAIPPAAPLPAQPTPKQPRRRPKRRKP